MGDFLDLIFTGTDAAATMYNTVNAPAGYVYNPTTGRYVPPGNSLLNPLGGIGGIGGGGMGGLLVIGLIVWLIARH